MRRKAFTLIELILYIALVSGVLLAIVQFGWNAIYIQKKSETYQELTSNLRLAEKRITEEIRNASGINSVAATSLCLASTNVTYNPVKIYLSAETLRIGWGGGSATCATTTNDQPLTSPKITISTLTFADMSVSGKTKDIHFDMTGSYKNPGLRKEFSMTSSISSSQELRSY